MTLPVADRDGGGANTPAVVNGSLQPIIPGFYPDPSICRVGDDYYLANSSFEYFPGVPIWHSTDLVQWTQIGHALTRRTQFRAGFSWPSFGVYGLTLRHHDDRFWMITTNFSDFESGQVLVSTTDPAGEWSDPVFIPGASGIDPDLCWEGDACFLTWRTLDSTAEHGILQARLDLRTGALGEIYPIWQGSGLNAPEGPHLYKVGEFWYLLLAEGGTERGHAVTVARASHPAGPFEACPENPIFTHRSLGHPVQSTGHADLVQTAEGEWAAVYLATRPRGYVPGFHVLGRETFVAGVRWSEGWPVFEEERYEVPVADTGFVDDFSSTEFHHRWVVPYSEPEAVARREGSSGLVLPPTDGAIRLLCTRVRDHHWVAEATVESAGRFCVRIDDRHWYGLHLEDGVVRADVRIGDIRPDLGSRRVSERPLVLRIESVPIVAEPVLQGHGGPDDIVLSVVDEDGRHELARIDGRYLSTEVATGFTGRMLALGSCVTESRVLSVSYSARAQEAAD
ncbi:family 43 glycosylhydrolase [Microbacteriaceae bacterium VKM Ac-2855]|nr:family 43 glycosylhydrolase [Microbacteriaceae bacterium VKM Ac-2855]